MTTSTTSTTTARPAMLYLRVSTSRQAENGVSLDMQEAMGRAHADRLGLQVVGVFREEGISGKEDVDGRPALRELLIADRALKGQGLDPVVIVYSIKRLARRMHTFSTLVSKDALVVSSITEPFDMSTPMGRAMAGMLAVFAQLEGEMISEQTRDALAHAATKGTLIGGAATSLDQLPEETIQAVIRGFEAGLSAVQIAASLTEAGVPTRRGGAWDHKAVITILKKRGLWVPKRPSPTKPWKRAGLEGAGGAGGAIPVDIGAEPADDQEI